jgi:hypothetical protein
LGVLSRLQPWVRFAQNLGSYVHCAFSCRLIRCLHSLPQGKHEWVVVAGATSKTLVAALHPHVQRFVCPPQSSAVWQVTLLDWTWFSIAGNASQSWHRLLSDVQYMATAYAVVGKLPLATFGVKR